MPKKTWKVLPKISDDLKLQLLYNRNLKSQKEIEKFFNPKLENYEKEFKIPGIHQAAKRIEEAIKKQDLTVIYGDYDVDGLCASAIAYLGLSSLGAKVLPYIPHREKEGYGLSIKGLDHIKSLGALVVLTVDNGIVAIEQARYAKEIGLDLVITDHHEPLDERPQALAIVHSTKMSGAAVCWSLIREMIDKDLAQELLQFVAISTITDLVPLMGVNRALVVEGLKVLNKTENIGLKSLTDESGVELGKIGTYEVGFMLGPRLNAIGRLEEAIDGLRLLCTKDIKKARNLAGLLSRANVKRQQLTISGVDSARLMVLGEKNIYVLSNEEWLPGVIGLIASKVCEEVGKPVIAISIGDGISKGSARSIEGINIIEILRECKDFLVDVGGHSKAAGFSIETSKIDQFRRRVEDISKDLKIEADKVLEIEAEIESKVLTKKLAKELEDFAPFGLGNPRPLFATRKMRVSGIRTVGNGKHLKFLCDAIECIGFGMGEMASVLKTGQIIDLAYYLEINKFNGSETLQLKIKDIDL